MRLTTTMLLALCLLWVSPASTHEPLSNEIISLPPCPEGTSATEWKTSDRKYLGCLDANSNVHGWVTSYHRNDVRRSLWEFRDGIPSGRYVQWFESGSKRVDGRFKNGLASGTWIWWWEDGQRRIEAIFENGELHGKFAAWHPNGQLAAEGNLQHGAKIDKWSYWTAEGNPTSTPMELDPVAVAEIFAGPQHISAVPNDSEQ